MKKFLDRTVHKIKDNNDEQSFIVTEQEIIIFDDHTAYSDLFIQKTLCEPQALHMGGWSSFDEYQD